MAIRLGTGDALLAEDVQIDFLPGGKLAVNGGDAVVSAPCASSWPKPQGMSPPASM